MHVEGANRNPLVEAVKAPFCSKRSKPRQVISLVSLVTEVGDRKNQDVTPVSWMDGSLLLWILIGWDQVFVRVSVTRSTM